LVIDPAAGRLTGTDSGVGRLPDPAFIVQSAMSKVVPQDLANKKVLVIAGGTREPIDPVRFIGNRSSGKQGIALVEEAVARGAKTQLVAANFSYYSPEVKVFEVVTTAELVEVLEGMDETFDYVVMPAAVSDYRAANPSATKIKKVDGSKLELTLIQNPDVITSLARSLRSKNPSVRIVGFAAETATGVNLVELATGKLAKKVLDLIVANDVSNNSAFDQDTNDVVLISSTGNTEVSGSKRVIAKSIFDAIKR
jgi:phosphopantothenoylcysteine decarboxylase/phosphopantothenate--cysteine ligase